jgi:hypothetical protein
MEQEDHLPLAISTNFIILNAKSEAFTVVMIEVQVFSVVTPCSVVVGYKQFWGP